MGIFKRQGAKAPRARLRQAGLGNQVEARPHRVTMELARAEKLASMLAKSRAARAVAVADFLAAMYLDNWDHLSQYWNEPEEIEPFLRTLCSVSPQRWHRWLLEYEDGHAANDGQRRLRFRGTPKNKTSPVRAPGKSRDLEGVLHRAGQISPFREKTPENGVPILTSECVLLAMAKDTESEVGRRLLLSGLNLARLEVAARMPKHAPRR